MASPEQYRRYAADCVTVAQQIGNPADRATLLLKAEIWLSLAEQAERAATGRPPAAADNRGDDRSA
jgi:hypothetical protein